MNRWYNLALRLCDGSDHDVKMAAVLVSGGRVLSSKPNAKERYKHAELRALRCDADVEGSTVYIAREGRRMSKPCPMCYAKLAAAKVARMVYANWDGELIVEDILQEGV